MSPRTLYLAVTLVATIAFAQEDSFKKNFKHFAQVTTDIDFFASNKEEIAVFEKPVGEARELMANLLGEAPKPGAVVICSTLEQKDSVNELRLLKLGYRWVIVQLTPEALNEEMLARMKERAAQIPPEVLDRMKNVSPEMKAMRQAGLVSSTLRNMAYAILTTTLAPEKEFRSSRLDDVGRSPLEDWLDIGIAAYVTGNATAGLRFLQDRLDEGFPLEDLLGMSRPFVPPSSGTTGGSGMVITMVRPGGGGASGAVAPVAGPAHGAQTISMPKDIQDRMLFDQQSTALFAYLVQKAGVEKAKDLVKWNRGGKSTRDLLVGADLLGSDLEKAEKDWQEWVKAQKTSGTTTRIVAPAGARPPQND